MALIIGIPVTTSGTAYTLDSTDTFLCFGGATIISTGGHGIISGSLCSITVAGHVYSSLSAIGSGAGNDIVVTSEGVLASELGTGVALGVDSKLSNAGAIAGVAGVLCSDGVTISNSGLIIAQEMAIQCIGDTFLKNTGTIRSLDMYSYEGSDGQGRDHIINRGLMIGSVLLTDGNDIYDGRSGRIVANAATGGVVNGGMGNDLFLGGKYVDTFRGADGNDTMTGGLGKDILTGGPGRDQFIFNSVKERGDTIADFGSDDTIVVKSAAFSSLPKGVLSAAAFHSNTTGLAHDLSDRFIYEWDADRLWYDSNGSAAGGRFMLADFSQAEFTRFEILVI